MSETCPECDKEFEDGRGLASHQRHKHPEPQLATADQNMTHSSGPADRAKHKAQKRTLLDRIDDLQQTIAVTGPEAEPDDYPQELRKAGYRLEELQSELDTTEEPTQNDLDQCEEVLAEIESTIDEYTAEIERTRTLQSRITTLEETVSEYEQYRDQLEETIAKKEERLARLKERISEEWDKLQAYGEGEKEAKETWQIDLPCAYCGAPIYVESGGRHHQQIAQVYGAVCSACAPTSEM